MGEISFPPEIRKWIADRVAEGYADEADYLAELVRRDMAAAARPDSPDYIARVREKIEEGLASGVSDQDPFEFLAELRAGRRDGAS